jgi:hypothetical protein
MKSPPIQYTDPDARRLTEEFIEGGSRKDREGAGEKATAAPSGE